ncbi:arylamine N-acetyltransferase [bacterium]|nr:arylamine N-acetyltransferase [bacterium]
MTEIERFLDHARINTMLSRQTTLERIIQTFAQLPYENITKIIRSAQSTDLANAHRAPAEVIADHLRWHTGGTCFSLTNTLLAILRFVGFEPEVLMADMKVGQNVHCALRLTVSGQDYLLDPGYLLDQPVHLPEEERSLIHTPMNRIIIERDLETLNYNVFVERNQQKKWRYCLKNTAVDQLEFDRHWDRSFSLNMMKSLTLSRITRHGQLYFSRTRLQLIDAEQRQSRNVRGHEADSIHHYFHIEPALVQQALDIVNRK